MQMVFCACGCGQLRPMFDDKGRQRRYINRHNKSGKTQIKKGQHLSPATEFKKESTASNKKRIPEEKIREWYWEKDKTQEEIATMFNVSIPTISSRMKEYGIPSKDTKIKKDDLVDKTYEELYGIAKAKEIKGKLRQSMKGENNPQYGKTPWNKGKRLPSEVVYKMLLRRTPNNEEKFMIDFFRRYNFPYKFVGDGKVIMGSKNPDFVNIDGQKKIIEFFGEHWHKPEDEIEKRAIYNSYGFDLLVIWGKELRDEKLLLKKLLNFNRR